MRNIGFVCLILAAAASAQDAAPTGGQAAPHHIVTQTRTVSVFGDLERKLATAVQKKDEAALKEVSAEDFELRMASQPGLPMPRDEWLGNVLPVYELRDFRFTQIAVHSYDEKTAVVSMNYWQDATVGGVKSSGDYFMVDVWRNTASGWKLAVRYVSPLEKKTAARHSSARRTESTRP